MQCHADVCESIVLCQVRVSYADAMHSLQNTNFYITYVLEHWKLAHVQTTCAHMYFRCLNVSSI